MNRKKERKKDKEKKKEREKKKEKERTRLDTRPPVADGWAGAEMRNFPLFDSIITDRRTDGWTKPLIELRVRNYKCFKIMTIFCKFCLS